MTERDRLHVTTHNGHLKFEDVAVRLLKQNLLMKFGSQLGQAIQ